MLNRLRMMARLGQRCADSHGWQVLFGTRLTIVALTSRMPYMVHWLDHGRYHCRAGILVVRWAPLLTVLSRPQNGPGILAYSSPPSVSCDRIVARNVLGTVTVDALPKGIRMEQPWTT
jgi:hypothetical protein